MSGVRQADEAGVTARDVLAPLAALLTVAACLGGILLFARWLMPWPWTRDQ